MYLNSIYYGNGYWGVVAASHGYFGVSPRRLTWGEASLLAGLPQPPSAYDPVYHLPLARLRQRHVLDQLVANGDLTSPQADAAFREPLPLGTRPPRSGAERSQRRGDVFIGGSSLGSTVASDVASHGFPTKTTGQESREWADQVPSSPGRPREAAFSSLPSQTP
jgi:membrane peptidoglycan carboxypeptidase